jgi:hypothetical protein
MMNMDARISDAQHRQRHREEILEDECRLKVTKGEPNGEGDPRARKVILYEPSYRSEDFRRNFKKWLRQTLPEFKFNGRQFWYEAPIEVLPKAKDALEKDWRCWLSAGAQEYLQDGV